MIYLLTSQPGPRLEYIAGILFGRLLRTEYRIISSTEQARPEGVLIRYDSEADDTSFCIPVSRLLGETGIIHKGIDVDWHEEVPMLLFDGEKALERFTIPFDILSAAFYLVTEYYYYSEARYDTHGRYLESADPTMPYDLHAQPVLHIYAEYLWQKLSRQFPLLKRQQRQFSFQFTFDIDAPYLFKYRPLWLQAAGLLKDSLKGNLAAMRKKIAISLGQQPDPYDTFNYIKSELRPEEAAFFFLINRRSAHDDRYTYTHKAYRKLITDVAASAFPVGIHPSYTSFLDPALIQFEKQKLEEITGKEITLARMHFLKYRLPDTYRHLLAAGIRDDYTSCMIRNAGYRHFIAVPFPWFDVASNTPTPLMIHPAMAMDRSLESYAGLNPQQALQKIKHYIALTARYQGHFILLMHNSSLSEYGEWKGWRNVFDESLRLARTEMSDPQDI